MTKHKFVDRNSMHGQKVIKKIQEQNDVEELEMRIKLMRKDEREEFARIVNKLADVIVARVRPYYRYDDDNDVLRIEFESLDLDTLIALVQALQAVRKAA